MRYDYDDFGIDDNGSVFARERGVPVLTPADWSAGRKPTGRTTQYNFVFPDRENRTKEDWPYSYTDHFLWGDARSIKGAKAVYSDRLSQWSAEKEALALKAVEGEDGRYGHWGWLATSKYLSVYFGKPIRAVAVAEGCNQSSGYPYWVFWYKESK